MLEAILHIPARCGKKAERVRVFYSFCLSAVLVVVERKKEKFYFFHTEKWIRKGGGGILYYKMKERERERERDVQRLTSTRLLNSAPMILKTSSRFIPKFPVKASLRGTCWASTI